MKKNTLTAMHNVIAYATPVPDTDSCYVPTEVLKHLARELGRITGNFSLIVGSDIQPIMIDAEDPEYEE